MDSNFKVKNVLIVYGEEELSPGEMVAVIKCRDNTTKALASAGFGVDIMPIVAEELNNLDDLEKKILDRNPDVIFNLCETIGEDSLSEAIFAGILEKTGIPFTGNSALVLLNCLNKYEVNKKLAAANINVPFGVMIETIADFESKYSTFKFPAIVKPCFQDASSGINRLSFVTSHETLYKSIKIKLARFPKGLLVEEFISGKEYAIGIIGNDPYRILGVSRIDYNNYPNFLPFLSQESKWDKNAPEYMEIVPELNPVLESHIADQIRDYAFRIGKMFSCRGYFRVDLREDQRGIFVLDVNPNPDLSKDAGLARMAQSAGCSYNELILKLVEYALECSYVKD